MAIESIYRPGLFRGQVVLVTGGGSGIGRRVALELAGLGATTLISGRNEEKLASVLEEIRSLGGAGDALVCDIRDELRVAQCMAEIGEHHGRLDGLVNNAGGQFPKPLLDISTNGWEAVVRNNLTGTFIVSREAVNRLMRPAARGAIVNVTSDFRNGWPGMGHSGAARAGIGNLTMTAAVEWARYGIRVNAVAPGIVESSGLTNYPPEFLARTRSNVGHIPVKRFATEAEISSGVIFLLTPGAQYITGTLLQIDGGLTLRGHITPLDDYAPLPAYSDSA